MEKKKFKEIFTEQKIRIKNKDKMSKETKKKIIVGVISIIYIIITLITILSNSFLIKADDNTETAEPVGFLVYFNLNYKPSTSEIFEVQLGYPPSYLVPLTWNQVPSNLNTTAVYRVATMEIDATTEYYSISLQAYENNNGELGNNVNLLWINESTQPELNLYMPLENYNIMITNYGEQILPYIENIETIYNLTDDEPPVITPPNPNITYYEANAKWDIFESYSTSNNTPLYYIAEWEKIYTNTGDNNTNRNQLTTILQNTTIIPSFNYNITNNETTINFNSYQTSITANNILRWTMYNEIININNIPSPFIEIAIDGASQVIRNIRYSITYTIKTAVIDENGNSATRTELITLNEIINTNINFTNGTNTIISLFDDIETKIENDVIDKGYSMQFTTIEDDIIINLFETTITFYIPPENTAMYINQMTYTDGITPLENNLYQNVNWFKNNISNGNNYILTDVDTSDKEFNILGAIANSLDSFFNTNLFGTVSLGEILWFVTGIGMLFALLKYFAGG